MAFSQMDCALSWNCLKVKDGNTDDAHFGVLSVSICFHLFHSLLLTGLNAKADGKMDGPLNAPNMSCLSVCMCVTKMLNRRIQRIWSFLLFLDNF